MGLEIYQSDNTGQELRVIDLDGDFSTGVDNDFSFETSLSDWQRFEHEDRLYVPGTEFGGVIDDIKPSTVTDTVTLAGDTWRGLLDKKIIEPDAYQDYLTLSGELNKILRTLIERVGLDSLFSVSDVDTKVSVNYQFDRYCTLLKGMEKMLKSKNYKLVIRYERTEIGGHVVLAAEEIKDYSANVELSQDGNLDFVSEDYRGGINHLICLGKGELQNRVVRHLYLNDKGEIVDSPFYTGLSERTSVYDYNNAEEEELIKQGKEEILKLANFKKFVASINDEADLDGANIGDIISGKDKVTGIYVKKPIIGKILTFRDGESDIELKIEEEGVI